MEWPLQPPDLYLIEFFSYYISSHKINVDCKKSLFFLQDQVPPVMKATPNPNPGYPWKGNNAAREPPSQENNSRLWSVLLVVHNTLTCIPAKNWRKRQNWLKLASKFGFPTEERDYANSWTPNSSTLSTRCLSRVPSQSNNITPIQLSIKALGPSRPTPVPLLWVLPLPWLVPCLPVPFPVLVYHILFPPAQVLPLVAVPILLLLLQVRMRCTVPITVELAWSQMAWISLDTTWRKVRRINTACRLSRVLFGPDMRRAIR